MLRCAAHSLLPARQRAPTLRSSLPSLLAPCCCTERFAAERAATALKCMPRCVVLRCAEHPVPLLCAGEPVRDYSASETGGATPPSRIPSKDPTTFIGVADAQGGWVGA